ncbi:HAD family hydrolase [Brevundimonas sp. Root1279]|uniref:HAD family hydrolase n=1 Tax=Brevundimonas sp. Root1279 TaxID=1736443 RepID=UPI0006F6DBF0|nr:HAD family phosphatase [Brevundimonas sp. Root1279]KQW83753.1 hypothetical protein ASC65_03660 [Brevundimonas sp. Root1279]
MITLPRLPAAVVFDMDGLIFDTERLWMAAMVETLAMHGHDMEPDFYLTVVGTPWVSIREGLLERFGPDLPADEIGPAWTERFVSLCRERLALKTGVVELLDELDALGIPAAVATSSPKALAHEHFDGAGLTERFQCILAPGDYERGKPDPAPYLAAARRLGVDPHDCLALEDSRNGVRSAAAAGMMTVMVPDLLGPTPEIDALCQAIAADLHEVRKGLVALAA